MTTDQSSPTLPQRTGLLALGLGLITTVAIFATIVFVSNDMRWILALGSCALFGFGLWLGGRRRGGPVGALLLCVPPMLAYAAAVLPEFPGLWPHLVAWFALAQLGWWGFRGERRSSAWSGVAVVAVGGLSCWYAVAYVPGEISRSLSRFPDQPAPSFTLERLDGSAYPMASLENKVVVLDFFATWCGPCVAELPELEAINRDLRSMADFQLLVVANGDDTPAAIQAFVDERKLGLPFAYDPDGAAHAAFGLAGMPGLVVIDRAGHVRLAREGYNSAEVGFSEDLVAFVRAL